MVVLWGLMEDGPLAAVSRCLEQLRVPLVFIDQRRLPEYVFEVEAGKGLRGKILGPHGSLDINEATAIYVRPYAFPDLDIFSDVDRQSETWRRALEFEESMLAWCELTKAMVVNRPGNMGSNSSKPFQLDIIREAGFQVPETLITTDPECVAEFSKKHGRVIYKSISGWRSIVSQLTTEDLARADDVVCCPTQFQRFIEGTDYRVHVLDDSVFAHRIECTDDDYRYSDHAKIEATKLSDELEQKCVNLTRRLGLIFAGIDLRLSVDGGWYCFEANPSPGFTYFDQNTGNIGLSLATHLSSAG